MNNKANESNKINSGIDSNNTQLQYQANRTNADAQYQENFSNMIHLF